MQAPYPQGSYFVIMVFASPRPGPHYLAKPELHSSEFLSHRALGYPGHIQHFAAGFSEDTNRILTLDAGMKLSLLLPPCCSCHDGVSTHLWLLQPPQPSFSAPLSWARCACSLLPGSLLEVVTDSSRLLFILPLLSSIPS